jgi:hypothetical protein
LTPKFFGPPKECLSVLLLLLVQGEEGYDKEDWRGGELDNRESSTCSGHIRTPEAIRTVEPPASPPGYSGEDNGVSGMSAVSEQDREMPGYTRQESYVSGFTSNSPSVGSVGYMGETSAPQSPVSALGKSEHAGFTGPG